MVDRVLDLLAPHICCSCGSENALLCENCYFDIKDEPFVECVSCGQLAVVTNLCRACHADSLLDALWVVGPRTGGLRELVDRYKFDRARRAGDVIAQLLDDRLPVLPYDTLVCYIPDIAAHRRQRGYDHMAFIARRFALRRKMSLTPLLRRRTHVSQRNLGRAERLQAQRGAFEAVGYAEGHVLLIDDIYTTGATLQAATDALRAAGVQTIYGAIVARQPLDETHDL